MRTATQPRYRPIPGTETPDVGYAHQNGQELEAEDTSTIPVKSIVLAVSLLIIGSILLTLGFLHLRGHIYSKDGAGWGLITLGLLTFIPGFYETRIAYHAWRGHKGFSYSAMPTY